MTRRIHRSLFLTSAGLGTLVLSASIAWAGPHHPSVARVTVAPGDVVVAELLISDAQGLASFEATILYDSDVISPTLITLGPMVPSDSVPLGPNYDETGAVSFGSYNATGATTDGDGILATARFVATAPGVTDLRLDPRATGATDTLGVALDAPISLGYARAIFVPLVRR